MHLSQAELEALQWQTDPVNRPRLERAYRGLSRLYELKREVNRVYWVESPAEATEKFNLKGFDPYNPFRLLSCIAAYRRFRFNKAVASNRQLKQNIELFVALMHGHLFWPFGKGFVASERPVSFSFDRYSVPLAHYRDGSQYLLYTQLAISGGDFHV